MVSPLDGLRPLGAPTPAPSASRPNSTGGDFAEQLRRATEELANGTPSQTPPAFDADPLAAIEQATQSMQRASTYINSARAYFRGGSAPGADPGASSGLDLRG